MSLISTTVHRDNNKVRTANSTAQTKGYSVYVPKEEETEDEEI